MGVVASKQQVSDVKRRGASEMLNFLSWACRTVEILKLFIWVTLINAAKEIYTQWVEDEKMEIATIGNYLKKNLAVIEAKARKDTSLLRWMLEEQSFSNGPWELAKMTGSLLKSRSQPPPQTYWYRNPKGQGTKSAL